MLMGSTTTDTNAVRYRACQSGPIPPMAVRHNRSMTAHKMKHAREAYMPMRSVSTRVNAFLTAQTNADKDRTLHCGP